MYSLEELHAAGLDDFRVFLVQVWEYLGLPPPTLVQLDIALEGLQKGPKRVIIQGFRGVGKSWITVAYVLWRLLLDPQIKIMVVSATQGLADNFSKFCKQIIDGMPLLHHLKPPPNYDAADEWNVGPALPSKDPSVKSVGITGQLTGSRADLIVPDDIEIPKNSFTFLLRERLAELVKGVRRRAQAERRGEVPRYSAVRSLSLHTPAGAWLRPHDLAGGSPREP